MSDTKQDPTTNPAQTPSPQDPQETIIDRPPDMSLAPGHNEPLNQDPHPPHIAGYRFVRFIAHGGMGAVWHAQNLKTNQDVAIKVIGPLWRKPQTLRTVFEKEIQLAAKLNHPNIARIYGGDPNSDPPYYVMQLIDGTPLEQYVTEHKPSPNEIMNLIRTICSAMHHAHQRLVVHRDLKFSNVLVTDDGKPYVIDFGLAKSLAPQDPYTTIVQPGYALGTLLFMSPEQAAGRADSIDTRTDVYSLGVMLYKLLTGKFPFDTDGHASEITRRIIEDEPQYPKNVDKDLASLLCKAVAKNPEDRYQSAHELAQDIANYQAHDPLIARPHTWTYRTRKYIQRNRRRVTIAAAAALTFASLASTAYYRIYMLNVQADIRIRHIEAQRVQTSRLVSELIVTNDTIEDQIRDALNLRKRTVQKINEFNSRLAIALEDRAEAEQLLQDMREWALESNINLPDQFRSNIAY